MFSSLGEYKQKFTCTAHDLLPGLHEQWVGDNTVFAPWCCEYETGIAAQRFLCTCSEKLSEKSTTLCMLYLKV